MVTYPVCGDVVIAEACSSGCAAMAREGVRAGGEACCRHVTLGGYETPKEGAFPVQLIGLVITTPVHAYAPTRPPARPRTHARTHAHAHTRKHARTHARTRTNHGIYARTKETHGKSIDGLQYGNQD